MNSHDEHKLKDNYEKVVAKANELAQSKGYISIWSLPFDMRMDLIEQAERQLEN